MGTRTFRSRKTSVSQSRDQDSGTIGTAFDPLDNLIMRKRRCKKSCPNRVLKPASIPNGTIYARANQGEKRIAFGKVGLPRPCRGSTTPIALGPNRFGGLAEINSTSFSGICASRQLYLPDSTTEPLQRALRFRRTKLP